MQDYRCKIEEGKFYHIFNRGINGTNLFYSTANYDFFLRRYDYYLSDFPETYAFCLLPNHFHLLVRVKDKAELDVSIDVSHFENVKHLNVGEKVSKQFQAFFTSYSKAINKQENRHGSLFEKPFRRIWVNSEKYLSNLVFYIHANPQLHGIIDDFRMYRWSSYERILFNKPTKLQKEKVLEWFTDKANYLYFHSNKIEIENIKELSIE